MKPTQAIPAKNSFANKGLLNSGLGTLKSQNRSQITNFAGDSLGNSSIVRGQNEKISL